MSKKEKKRLDVLVLEQHQHLTRNQIQSFIMQGKVLVDGVKATKPGTQVATDAEIVLSVVQPKFASRAGFKLEAALEQFDFDVIDRSFVETGEVVGSVNIKKAPSIKPPLKR